MIDALFYQALVVTIKRIVIVNKVDVAERSIYFIRWK